MDIIKSYVMRLEGDDMNKLAYDSLHKFLVSIGTLLVITPFVAVYFIIQGDVQLISVEEYQALSDYSKHVIDSKEYLLRISKYAVIPFFVVIIALGITLFVWGVRGWKKNQIELDEQTRLSNDEVRKKLQDYDKEEKRYEAEPEIMMAEETCEFCESELDIEYTDPKQVKKDFFDKAIFEYIRRREYEIEQSKKIDDFYFDGIAISKTGIDDIIYEVKWWPNCFDMNAINSTCDRLAVGLQIYKKATRRECIAQLVVVTKEDFVMDFEIKIRKRFNSYYNDIGISVIVISEEALCTGLELK